MGVDVVFDQDGNAVELTPYFASTPLFVKV